MNLKINCLNYKMSNSDSDEDNYFRESLQEGLWKQVTLKNIDFDIVVEKGGNFERVIIKLSSFNQNIKNKEFDYEYFYENGFLELENNTAILSMEQKGKWLGIISATLYDKTTEYLLVDLEKTISDEIRTCKYLGSTRGGWVKTLPITNVLVDFEKEIVYKNKKTKSFDDCLDPEVDERELNEERVLYFNKNRNKNNLLRYLLNNFANKVSWKGNSKRKLERFLSTDLDFLEVKCVGNVSGKDLTYRYDNSLFKSIEDIAVKLNYLVPITLFGTVNRIVEIDLTWTINYKDDELKVVISQKMKIDDYVDNRFNVDPNIPALITIE